MGSKGGGPGSELCDSGKSCLGTDGGRDEIFEKSSDAFIVINLFHVDRAKRKLCLGESVIQVQQNNYIIFTCFKFRVSVEEKSFTTRIAKNQYSCRNSAC